MNTEGIRGETVAGDFRKDPRTKLKIQLLN